MKINMCDSRITKSTIYTFVTNLEWEKSGRLHLSSYNFLNLYSLQPTINLVEVNINKLLSPKRTVNLVLNI